MAFHSILLFFSTFIALALSTYVGRNALGRRFGKSHEIDDDLKVVSGAVLSLLGLLIGFSLSMAIGGFNARQQAEEAEAVAVRNAFQRTSLMDLEHQSSARALLRRYLEDRIHLYKSLSTEDRQRLRLMSTEAQSELWKLAADEALEQPTPIKVMVLSSINDLFNSQQKTIADWRRQMPSAAWILLAFVAICCNGLIGFGSRGKQTGRGLLWVMPAMISLAFLMIAEIDVPGEGLIRVQPVNLRALNLAIP